jgi:hypothetical protein
MKLTVGAVNATTTPDLGAVWFSSSYWRMAAVAALLTVPFLVAAAIQAMLRSDLTLLLRSAFGYLPLGMLAVGVAAPLTGLLLAGSDELSTIVSSASGHEGANFLGHVGALATLVSGASGTVFLSFFIAVFTIAAAITLWLELLIRQAAVYVIVLMLPLFFAAMVWPARRIWAARAVELLVALILAKFAIVAVLGLGGAALGHTPLPGVGSLLAGTTLVLLAAFSPWAMLRLLPLHELAGAAVGGLRPHGATPVQAADARAHGTTDAAEDAAGATAPGSEATTPDPTEDVASQLPARLREMAPPDGTGGDGAPDADGAGPAPSATPGPSASAADASATAGPSASAAPAASTVAATAAHPAAPTPADPMPADPMPADPMPADPETDAFGTTVRHGELPEVFRSMSLDADILQLEPPGLDGGGPLPELGPAAQTEPEDEPA